MVCYTRLSDQQELWNLPVSFICEQWNTLVIDATAYSVFERRIDYCVECRCVCVCNKLGVSVYSIINRRVSPSLNGKVSFGIDSKQEELAHLFILITKL